MVILVVFKGFLLVKNLEILIQIILDSPIYYYYPRPCSLFSVVNWNLLHTRLLNQFKPRKYKKKKKFKNEKHIGKLIMRRPNMKDTC